uniref:Alpha-L-fucosidase n=1 Tax=Monodelphis domestica TaxID=13616 RepID=A0A5F8H5K4_MONDO
MFWHTQLVPAWGPALLLLLLLLLLSLLLPGCWAQTKIYEPTWDSLDARKLPAWFDEDKLGIFIHWGSFSKPRFRSEWFWWYWRQQKIPAFVDFMKVNYPPDLKYEDFALEFKGTFFNATQWADIFQASGAKYIVLTTKHHEGFNLWKSKSSWNWNSVDRGPRRDIVKEMEVTIRNKTDLHFGLYYSLFEWFNPLFLLDKANKFKSRRYPVAKCLPDLYDLVNTYKPEVLWADGDGDASDTYRNSTVPDIVVTNDHWGLDNICRHGGYYTCSDCYNPGYLLPHKWENLSQLVETVSCGGNFLMNIGPNKDGVISPIFEERLREIGAWMKVSGEAIYKTKPWRAQNDTPTPRVWSTSKPKENLVYAIFLQWPSSRMLVLGEPKATSGATKVKLLGYQDLLKWITVPNQGIIVELPQLTLDASQWIKKKEKKNQ